MRPPPLGARRRRLHVLDARDRRRAAEAVRLPPPVLRNPRRRGLCGLRRIGVTVVAFGTFYAYAAGIMARDSALEHPAPTVRGDVIQPGDVHDAELARVEKLIEATRRASAKPSLIGPDREPIELPDALFHAL